MAPDVLLTLELINTSFVLPVEFKVTVPEPPAVTVLPTVKVPVVAVKLTVPFAAVLMAPLVVSAPVLLTVTFPAALCVIPVRVNAAVFVNAILPLLVFVALKLETVLAAFKVVPPTELVVKRAPLNSPAALSDTVPAVPVNEILPVVVILPAFKVK